MYNILLVDDEQIVIDSLTFILEKNFPGQVSLISAKTGSEAVTICQNQKIDIAFMDISMPGLNGMEAIKSIREFNASIVFIVLTAFDRFDFAQQAINLGVFEYLSKPVNRNRIINTVRNAMTSIEQSRKKQKANIQIREKLDSVVNIVESDFIYSLIFPSEKTSDLESYLEFFNISETHFYFITIEIKDIHETEKNKIYMIVRDIILSTGLFIIGPLMRNRVVVFAPISISLPDDEEEIKKKLLVLHSRLSSRLGKIVKIGVSGFAKDLMQSFALYNESLHALMNNEQISGVFYITDTSNDFLSSEQYPEDVEKKLIDRSLLGDIQGAHTLFSGLCSWFSIHYPQSLMELKTTLVFILNIIRYQTKQFFPHFGGFHLWKDTFLEISNFTNRKDLEMFVLSNIDECIAAISEHKQNRMNPIIAKACAIIEESLSKDISLDEISKRVEISPFYFSKLFKEETGENFIDFVTMLRVQKAKQLLKETNLSIKEISADTGYSDPNYFSKLFKKVVGCTPTEYRDSV